MSDRQSFFPTLFLCCSISLFVACERVAAQASTSATTTSVQVVYLIDGNTINTYDVDPQTLYATQVGSLATGASPVYYILYPSPSGRFLYLVGFFNNSSKRLWVYQTDASGAPQAPPTQVLSFNGFYGMEFDPRGNFAYAVFASPYNTYETTYRIRRYLVSATDGSLSGAIPEAKYILSTDVTSNYCYVGLSGFNASATTFYDNVSCNGHDSEAATYYERTLNSSTGALGPESQIYSWNNGTQGFESVYFVANHMFDFAEPNDYDPGIDSVSIYPIVPNTSTPIVHCTAAMLEACGNATGVVHPSGKYVFMEISQDSTQIDRVELTNKKIVDTGNYVPYRFGQFSPDGTLVYATEQLNTGYFIHIYGFNSSTSQVTSGGVIGAPSGLDTFYAAKRN